MQDWMSNLDLVSLVIAVVLGVGAIVVSVALWRSDRVQKRKRLGFEVRSNSPVIGPSIVDQSEWHIEYKGESVFDPYVIEVQLENTGAVPIRPEDFESGRPITIGSGSESMFIAISQESTYPGELSLDIELDDHELRVNPMLMNRGEGFTLTVVTAGKSEPEPSARIAGLDEGIEDGIPEISSSVYRLAISALVVSAALFAVLLLMDMLLGFDRRSLLYTGVGNFASAMGLISYLAFMYGFVISRQGKDFARRLAISLRDIGN